MRLVETLAEFVEELGNSGFAVFPNFVSESDVSEIRNDIKTVQNTGGFQRAGMGKTGVQDIRDHTRLDETYWLERGGPNPVQNLLLDKFDLLQCTINRSLFLGLKGFEGHYASYPKGGFYRRHLDAFGKKNTRAVSAILYLNAQWKPSDGGQLRIYNANSHTDIEPHGGTLVCFLSREFEHEVLVSHSNRLSFTGWFTVDVED